METFLQEQIRLKEHYQKESEYYRKKYEQLLEEQ